MMRLVQRSEPMPGCVCLAVNRPERRNALCSDLVEELTKAVSMLEADAMCRVILLTGEGSSFCAGLDLEETLTLGALGGPVNQADADRFAALLFTIYTVSKPIIGLVNGPAFGAGAGLVAACDIALASDAARFRFPEVAVGLTPAVISPYILNAIGARAASRFFLTGETIDSATALDIGLVHGVVPHVDLLKAGVTLASEIRRGGPQSLAACKQLLHEVMNRPISAELAALTATRVAVQRASAEAQHGIRAALEKRLPPWLAD